MPERVLMQGLELYTTQALEHLRRAANPETDSQQAYVHAHLASVEYRLTGEAIEQTRFRGGMIHKDVGIRRDNIHTQPFDRWVLQLGIGLPVAEYVHTIMKICRRGIPAPLEDHVLAGRGLELVELGLYELVDSPELDLNLLSMEAEKMAAAGHYNRIFKLLDHVRNEFPNQLGG